MKGVVLSSFMFWKKLPIVVRWESSVVCSMGEEFSSVYFYLAFSLF